MNNKDFKENLYKRLISFTVKIVRFLKTADLGYTLRSIEDQIIRSASSIGANFSEGNGADSKKEFIRYMGHARRSAIETKYWLDTIENLIDKRSEHLKKLQKENEEILRIFSSIILSVKRKNRL